LLKGSIRLLLKEDRIGILFSGGLDSSILTKLILDEVTEKQVDIVTVGMKDSYDIKNAVQRAVELGFQLNCCYLDKSIVKSSITCLTEKNIVSGIRELSIAIPLYLGMKFLSDSCESKMVVLGQGADELFGGYNKYSILYKESKMEELEKCMKTDLENLISKQLVMEREIA
jgi:asparagine synthase (glutamine-hydrolysing)